MAKLEHYSQLEKYFESLYKSDDEKMQPAKGVQQSYKDIANKSANVMFRAKIKGHKELDEGIPLHMTVKTFDKPEQMPIDDIKNKAEELDIHRPDPHSLKYEPITFTSKRNGNTYYMLKITGVDPKIEQLNNHFSGQGITHDSYMTHITINKELHDKIKAEGIEPHEVEFSPLVIEHGAGNITHLFQDKYSHKDHESDLVPQYNGKKLAASEQGFEDLQKGKFKEAIVGAAMIGAMATSTPVGNAAIDHQPKAGSHEIEANHPGPKYSSQKMLRTIASVESNDGQYVDHADLSGMHAGERAFGKYGLTPVIIRETIKMNRDLKDKHGKATMLQGQDMQNYMQDNPGLEDAVAQKHLSRLEHHFGQNPSHIGYAWLNGVSGTYKAKREKKNIESHWHVMKIQQAYHQPATTAR